MLTSLFIGFGLYGLACAFLWLWQRHMIYFPTKASREVLAEWAREAGLDPWLNPAGQRIGWQRLSPTAPGRWRVLITHGNAGCAVHRSDYARLLQAQAPADVFILEYPGYGDRPGAPAEPSLCLAAEEAFGLLGTNRPVYLVGESLGTGVAAHLAAAHPQQVAGMLLIAPFNNFTAVARRHMALFPVRWLLRDRFPSDTWLKNYGGPVAVLLAGRDEVVPHELGRKLYDGYAGPKRLWTDPRATHNDVFEQPPQFWREVVEFWQQNSPAP